MTLATDNANTDVLAAAAPISSTFTFPTSVAAGDALVIGFTELAEAQNITDITGTVNATGWQLLSGPTDHTASTLRSRVYGIISTGAGTETVTVTHSAAVNGSIGGCRITTDGGAITFGASATPIEHSSSTDLDSNTVDSGTDVGAVLGVISTGSDQNITADGTNEVDVSDENTRLHFVFEPYATAGVHGIEATAGFNAASITHLIQLIEAQDSGITGDLAATEAQDTAAIAGEVNIHGDLAATEAQDTAAIAGEVNVTGDLSATEAQDTAAIAGEVNIHGDLAATEAQDTATASGTVEQPPGPIAGDLSATEAQDTAAIAGTVEQPAVPITGDLSATEAQDTAAIAGEVDVHGDLAATEAQDVAAITGDVATVSGTLAATDEQDTAAISGELADCVPKVLNMRAPDLEGLLAVAFLDRFERFAKRDEDVAEIRLFYGVQYCPPYVAFTPAQFRTLPLATRDAIRNAGSAAGLIDTEHKSNA